MAIYLDRFSQFLRARKTTLEALPFRLVAWVCTDYGNQVLVNFQHDSDDTKYIRIGIDSAGKWYVECSTTGGFPTPTHKWSRVTSTYTVSQHEWVQLIVEVLTYTDRRIRVNGANYASATVRVAMPIQREFHLGASQTGANGTERYPNPAVDPGYKHPNMFRGYVSQLAWWRNVDTTGLLAQDALDIYRAGNRVGFYEANSLQHYFAFEGPQFHDEVEAIAWSTAPEIASRRWGIVEYKSNPSDNDELTAGNITYRFRVTPIQANDIQIAASVHNTFNNVALAFNNEGGSSNYHTDTMANTEVWGFTYVNLRGDNNEDCLVVYEQDPSPGGSAPDLDDITDAGDNMECLDYDGNVITALADAKEYFEVKRLPIWYDGSSSDPLEPDAQGYTNHGQDPPLNLLPPWCANVGGVKPGLLEINRTLVEQVAALGAVDRDLRERFRGLAAGVRDIHAGQSFRRHPNRAYVA